MEIVIAFSITTLNLLERNITNLSSGVIPPARKIRYFPCESSCSAASAWFVYKRLWRWQRRLGCYCAVATYSNSTRFTILYHCIGSIHLLYGSKVNSMESLQFYPRRGELVFNEYCNSGVTRTDCRHHCWQPHKNDI